MLTGGEGPDNWWQLYDDEQLNHLIADALTANTSLRIATANLARTEAVAMEADGAREIKAAASADIARARVSGESFLLEHAVPVLNLGDAGIRLGYQVDLVGGLKRAIEAAEADVEASRAVLDLARDLDRETALREARDAAAEAHRQVRTFYQAGRLPYLDDLDAERNLATAEIALADSATRIATDQIRLFLALGSGWRSMP